MRLKKALLLINILQCYRAIVVELPDSRSADVTVDKETISRVKVTLNSPFLSFFDQQRCEGTKKKIHVPADSTPYVAQVEWSDNEVLAKGALYEGEAEVLGRIFNSSVPLIYALETSESPACDATTNAKIGLAIGDSKNQGNSFFEQLSNDSTVIIKTGAYPHGYEDGTGPSLEDMKSFLVYDEDAYGQCESPPKFHDVDVEQFNGKWVLKGRIAVGKKWLGDGLTIGFDLEPGAFPAEALRLVGPMSKTKAENKDDPYPDMWLVVDGHSYSMTADDYITYGSKDKVFHVLRALPPTNVQKLDYRLGQEFLQNYCLFLQHDEGRQRIGFGKLKSRRTEDPPPPLSENTVKLSVDKTVDVTIDSHRIEQIEVTLSAPYVFFFDKGYHSGCSLTERKKYHVPAKFFSDKAVVKSQRWFVDLKYTAVGPLYQGTAKVLGRVFTAAQPLVYGLEMYEEPECEPSSDARVGLSLPQLHEDRQYAFISQLLKDAPEKTVIIRSGQWLRKMKDGTYPKDVTGYIAYGRANLEGCETPAKYHDVEFDDFKGEWGVYGKIIIGNTMVKQTFPIGFNLMRPTTVPILGSHLLGPSSRGRWKKPPPSVWVVFGGESYVMHAEDYAYYTDNLVRFDLPDNKGTPQQRFGFVLGQEFLQNYCLFLKLNADGTQSLGLGRNTARRRAEPPPPPPPTPAPPTTTPTTSTTTGLPTPPDHEIIPIPRSFEIPNAFMKVNVTFEDETFDSVALSLNTPMLYVLSDTARKTCPRLIPKTHRQKYLRQEAAESFIDGMTHITGCMARENVELFGTEMKGLNFMSQESVDMCVPSANAQVGLAHIGDGDGEKKHSLVAQLLEGVANPDERVVILQRGPFYRPTRFGDYPSPKLAKFKGRIAWGFKTIDQCNPPPVYHPVEGRRGVWVIKASIQVGTWEMDGSVAFDLNGDTQVPADYARHYFIGPRKSERVKYWPWASVRFTADNHTYFMTPEDYLIYSPGDDHQTPAMRSAAERISFHADFVMGAAFLQNYCLFLKLDADGTQSLGLGTLKGSERPVPPPDPPTVDSAHRSALSLLLTIILALATRLLH